MDTFQTLPCYAPRKGQPYSLLGPLGTTKGTTIETASTATPTNTGISAPMATAAPAVQFSYARRARQGLAVLIGSLFSAMIGQLPCFRLLARLSFWRGGLFSMAQDRPSICGQPPMVFNSLFFLPDFHQDFEWDRLEKL